MRTEWVVLADGSRARVFARVGGGSWQGIRDLTRGGDEAGTPGREVRLPPAMQRMQVAAVRHDSQTGFLERVAEEVCSARKRGDFDALILVAPAEVLAALQDALDAATRRTLAATAAENLVVLPIRDARRELSRRF